MSTLTRCVASIGRLILGDGRGPRRYIPAGQSVEAFFAALDEQRVQYCVLRWFDDLPQVDPGEDIDLLVSDDSLHKIMSIVTRRRPMFNAQKLDIYTVSGTDGTSFNELPYYQPHFAERLLEGAVLKQGKYRIPNSRDHFDSLAYHAVYHKGKSSGLPPDDSSPVPIVAVDHDYFGVLSRLSKELDLNVPINLAKLDEYLHEAGLKPAFDTLERLQTHNDWLRGLLAREPVQLEQRLAGLTVFVLRCAAEEKAKLAEMVIDRAGFELIRTIVLTEPERRRVSRKVRGGNWAKGPWPVDAGGPAVYIICWDVAPVIERAGSGAMSNSHVAEAKASLRTFLLRGVSRELSFNPAHSSDNADQALDYLRTVERPGLVDEVLSRAENLHDVFEIPFPVVADLQSYRRRARTAVIEHPVDGMNVIKVYRPGAVRYLARELLARTEFSGVPNMPEVLEVGRRWFTMPLYEDTRAHVLRSLPNGNYQLRAAAVEELVKTVRAIHEAGYVAFDLTTNNVMTDRTRGLRLIDFEFLQRLTDTPGPLRKALSLMPRLPADLPYDVPTGTSVGAPGVTSLFHPAVTGLPKWLLVRRRGVLWKIADPVQAAWFWGLWAHHLAETFLGTSWYRDLVDIGVKVRSLIRQP